MTTDAPDGRADPIDVIFHSLDDAEWGRRRLPRLVSLLTHDRTRVRIGAGWAITYVAAERSDTAPYLVRRLGDRLTDDVPPAVEQAFFGVATRYPDVVETELPDILRDDEGDPPFARELGGSMLRADYAMGGEWNRDVGRVRFPEGSDAGKGRVFTSDERDDRWRLDLDGTDCEGAQGVTDGNDDVNATADEPNGGRPRGRPARELWARTDYLRTITGNCRFDDLAVMSQRRRGRYADGYRTRAERDDETFAVSLSLFHEPETNGDRYEAALDAALARWQSVDDVEGVRTLYDWGREPRPWALVEYADKDLRQRDRFSTDEALWNARHLAASLSHVHENGVVHAGVDPGNVSYHENLLDPEERQIPMLTNVGLLSVVRAHFDPTRRLDPRYAAPEYFDRRFGRIDHATDVYGLGALVYDLFTGRPPYVGDYASIRDAVQAPTPPEPSAVTDVPAGIDEIVAKATATDKLHRYEAVAHMAADLRSIAEREDIGHVHEAYPRGSHAGDASDAESGQVATETAPGTAELNGDDVSVGDVASADPGDDPEAEAVDATVDDPPVEDATTDDSTVDSTAVDESPPDGESEARDTDGEGT